MDFQVLFLGGTCTTHGQLWMGYTGLVKFMRCEQDHTANLLFVDLSAVVKPA